MCPQKSFIHLCPKQSVEQETEVPAINISVHVKNTQHGALALRDPFQ